MTSSVSSASAIGRIAPGSAEQWHMIMPFRLGNGKAQRHDIEEGRIAAVNTPTAVVVTKGKAQFIATDRQGTAADQRCIGATIVVGDGSNDAMCLLAGELVKLDPDPDGRMAGMRIENMGREPAIDPGHALTGHCRH